MDSGYNGFKNYQTWVVKLWLDNDELTYKYFRNRVKYVLQHESDELEQIYEISQAVQLFIDEAKPDLGANLYADVLEYALQDVDTTEIAKLLIEEQ